MAKVWTQPKDWQLDDVLNAPVLNQEIRDNLEYLAERAASWKRYEYPSDTDVITNINTWEHITELDVEITTSLSRVLYSVTLPVINTSGIVYADIYIPELNIYLSSLTATPSTKGLAQRQSASASYDISLYVNAPVELVAGTYTFQVYLYSSVVSCSLAGTMAIIPFVREF